MCVLFVIDARRVWASAVSVLRGWRTILSIAFGVFCVVGVWLTWVSLRPRHQIKYRLRKLFEVFDADANRG